MARIPRSVQGGVVYHVLNRSNNKITIFKSQKDYLAFEKIISEGHDKYPIKILSYCIMPNHWHFVLLPSSSEEMPLFMKWITLTHTNRYHSHHDSIGAGHLYQGRYKSFPVAQDEHFLRLCAYVERNLLKANLVGSPLEWKWSSLWAREYGSAKQKQLLSDWPVEVPANYIDWVSKKNLINEPDLKHIQTPTFNV